MGYQLPKAGLAILTAAIGLCIATPAPAQLKEPAGAEWQFEFAPSFWAAEVDVSAHARRQVPPVTLGLHFTDRTDTPAGGLTGSFEVRKGRVGVVLDLSRVNFPTHYWPLFDGRLGTLSAQLDERIYQLGGAYRAWNDPTVPIDLFFGLRYTSLEAKVGLSPGLFPIEGKSNKQADWLDGYAGVRIAWRLTDRWTAVGYADIGGGSTKKSWQAIVGGDYALSKNMSLKFGYRALSNQFERRSFDFTMKTDGIYAGLGIRF